MQDYKFCYDQRDYQTLVMLKKLNCMNLGSFTTDVLPSFIMLPDPVKSNMNKATLKIMVNQHTSVFIIDQFIKLAAMAYPNQLGNI